MPEMTFTVAWPDGRVQQCSSPSLVMWDHLVVGADYRVTDFVDRTTAGLDEAAERVRARYGFACTSAMTQRDELHAVARTFPRDAVVRVLAMAPPLPVQP